MEPADLNAQSDDRRLAALLRQADVAIPDNGFSARVLAALPPPAVPREHLLPTIAGLAGFVAGLVYAWLHGLTPSDLTVAGAQLKTLLLEWAPLFDSPWGWLAVVTVLASCYSALRLSGFARSPFQR